MNTDLVAVNHLYLSVSIVFIEKYTTESLTG